MDKLYLGDCLDVMQTLDDDSIDFIFTSPPYNRKRNDKYSKFNDVNDNYYELLSKVIDIGMNKSKYIFLNLQKNYYNKQDVFNIIGNYANNIIDIIIWSKSNPMPASGFNVTNAYEFILILSSKTKSIKAQKTYTKNHINTSVYSENPYKKIHRAVMKPAVVEWFIERFTKENDIVLDPFLGLGTTAIECARANRRYIGIELNEHYYNIACKRINDI